MSRRQAAATKLGDLTGPGGAAKGNPTYEVMGVTRYWRYSEEPMEKLIRLGRVVQSRPGAIPRYKRYLEEMPASRSKTCGQTSIPLVPIPRND